MADGGGTKIGDMTRSTLDSSKPDAIVTAASEQGFTYEYDRPIPFGRAAWGEMMIGGDCYPEGYAYWWAVD